MSRLKLALALVVLFMLAGCGVQPAEEQKTPSPDPQPGYVNPVPAPANSKNPITGEPYLKHQSNVLAVMVENTPQARPQSGLDKAEVVYEMTTEGGITRFMAIYHANDADIVGPVRSARTYFVTMVREWNAGYAHAGGNQDALNLVTRWGLQDLDEIYRLPAPYWRDLSRQAPHNLYTNTEKLRPYVTGTAKLRTWPFEQTAAGGGQPQTLTIPYNSFTTTTYTYDPGQGVYLRSISGKPHVDRNSGTQLRAANVIVQYAVHKSGGVEPGAIDITLTGKGKAEYFKLGEHYTGYWEKSGLDEETKFYLDDGSLFKLRPGVTWIQVVPTTMQLLYQ